MNKQTTKLIQDIADIVTSTERPSAIRDGHSEATRLNRALDAIYQKLNDLEAQGIQIEL